MCWYGKMQDKHIAKENVRVFKVCRYTDNIIAPYFRQSSNIQSYKEGNIYHDSFGMSPHGINGVTIARGLHSYAIDSIPLKEYSTSSCDGFKVITSKMEYVGPWARIVLCTIPKGSVYYLNEFGEIVSNCLRIDKLITSRVAYDNIKEINEEIISFKFNKH